MQTHGYTAPIFERTPDCIGKSAARTSAIVHLLELFSLLQMKGSHYPFPHTRIKLQRDPKDHTVSGMFS